MTDLQALLDAARKHVDEMTPEEREKMWEEQRASWVRAIGMGWDFDGVVENARALIAKYGDKT